METNVKMKRKIVRELEMEQIAARHSMVVGDNVAVRDSITAGCRVAAGRKQHGREGQQKCRTT